jgi:hypothetical protein
MAISVVRKALLALLLLLFCSENMALASVFDGQSASTASNEHIAPRHSTHFLINLLAEESEERQERDDVLLTFERDVHQPHELPLGDTWKGAAHSARAVNARSVPFYTLHHTLII